MLSLTRTWQCDIWPHAVRLRHDEQVILTRERRTTASLEAAVTSLLDARPASMAWLDAIEFHPDTEELDFLVLPWQHGITSPEEMRCLARLQASQSLARPGERAEWRVSFEESGWGRPALVACLQQPFWQQLAGLARQQRLRFQGVVTPFQQLLRHYSGALPDEGVFVCVNAQHTRIACRRQGEWRDVCTLTLPCQDRADLLQIVSRLTGMAASDCHVLTVVSREYTLVGAGEPLR